MKRKIYTTRDLARQDIFDYIEMFYNPVRKHGSNDMLSPIEYEKRYFMKLGRVYKTQGDTYSDIFNCFFVWFLSARQVFNDD
ncbi:MAG TPA: hypothetical protein EYN54_09350 [Methylococcaceae bacterium]|nr:hypothetical protein [Methylococcaceae bacterium]